MTARRRSQLVYVVVLVWFIAVFAALLNYSQQLIVEFDPTNKLATQSMAHEFENNLIQTLQHAGASANTVLHITDNAPCYCDTLSQQHQQALQTALADTNYRFKRIVASQHLATFIDSYPAVAIVDEAMNLRYIGPYATGIGCWVGDDTVAVISRLASAPISAGAVVNGDVEGCFCRFSA